jgi:hypothetical protein
LEHGADAGADEECAVAHVKKLSLNVRFFNESAMHARPVIHGSAVDRHR